MFEKFSVLDVDSAGRGGEYTVQAGFGWTNGVVLWIASNYGDVLNAPACPDLKEAAAIAAGAGGSGTSGGGKGGENGGKNAAGRVGAERWLAGLAVGLVGVMML